MKRYVLESFEIEDGDKHHLPNIGSQKFESVTIIPSDALIQIDFQSIYDYAKADIDQEIARIDEEKQKKRDLAEYERLKKLFEKDTNK